MRAGRVIATRLLENSKGATEELEVLRESVTESMTTKERAEEMLYQSEE